MSTGRLKAASALVASSNSTRLAVKFLADFIEVVQFANIHAALHQLVSNSGDPETFYSNLTEKGITQSLAKQLTQLNPNLAPPTPQTNEYLEAVGKQAFANTLERYCNLNASAQDAAARGEDLESEIVMNCKRIQVKLEALAHTQKQLEALENQKANFYLPQGSNLTDDDLAWFKEDLDLQPWLGLFQEPVSQIEDSSQD